MSNGQENNNAKDLKKSFLPPKLKPLDHVKIFGSNLNHVLYPKADSNESGVVSATNSSSTCSDHPKQQQQQHLQKSKNKPKSKKLSTYPERFNRPPSVLLSESLTYRASELSMKNSRVPQKIIQNVPPKRSVSTCLPAFIPQVLPEVPKEKASSLKRENPLPPIRQLSTCEEIEADRYTYAASTTSTVLTMNKKNTSVLSILLESTPCVGVQTREIRSKKAEYDIEENHEENDHVSNNNTNDNDNDNDDDVDDNDDNDDNDNDNDDDSYYHLLDYRNLINDLPKPIVSLRPRYGQDDFEILYEQLDHIRETMPSSNIYNDYARIV